jgi:hypothetical protein
MVNRVSTAGSRIEQRENVKGNETKILTSTLILLMVQNLAFGSEVARFVELKGKKAIEQFMDYRFQKENDPIINELQKQYQTEDMPPEFSEEVNNSDLQKEHLVGHGVVDDENKTKYILLEFRQLGYLNKTVYSVYRKSQKNWFLIGELFSECKYNGPALRFEKCPGHILISVLYGGGGTNVFDDEWNVYEIVGENLLPVFSYPGEGNRDAWGLSYDVEFKAGEINWVSSGKQPAGYLDLDINYLKKYALGKNGNKDLNLFEKKKRYFLSWNDLKSGFLWTDETGKSADPFGDISFFDRDEIFLNKYKGEIEEIGKKSDPASKAWYAAFMESIKSHGRSKWEE